MTYQGLRTRGEALGFQGALHTVLPQDLGRSEQHRRLRLLFTQGEHRLTAISLCRPGPPRCSP
jgi:hypothetical protein